MPRFSFPHGHQGWSQRSQGSSRKGPQAPLCVERAESVYMFQNWQHVKGTIKSKEDVERLFSSGRRSSSYVFTVLQCRNEENENGRCAFIAGKKLGNAPLRNRCKRVMREVARELGAPWDGYDVAFIAHRKTATESHEKLLKKARVQLSDLGVIS